MNPDLILHREKLCAKCRRLPNGFKREGFAYRCKCGNLYEVADFVQQLVPVTWPVVVNERGWKGTAQTEAHLLVVEVDFASRSREDAKYDDEIRVCFSRSNVTKPWRWEREAESEVVRDVLEIAARRITQRFT